MLKIGLYSTDFQGDYEKRYMYDYPSRRVHPCLPAGRVKCPLRRFKLKADGCSVGFYGLIESILARKIIMNASAIPIVTLKEHSAIT